MTTFLETPLATPFNLFRRPLAEVYSLSGKRFAERNLADRPVQLIAGIRPDTLGRANLAGRLSGHLSKHKSRNLSFAEVCPQKLNTLASTQAVRTIRAKTDAGTYTIPASGTIEGLAIGRFISLGTSNRLYEVVDKSGDDFEIDIPLQADLARGDAINFSPTANWLWEASMNEPPEFTRGINSGIGFLLEAREEIA